MPSRTGNEKGEGKPETLNFLGFTHISGENRNGKFTVRRQTIGKHMRAKNRAKPREAEDKFQNWRHLPRRDSARSPRAQLSVHSCLSFIERYCRDIGYIRGLRVDAEVTNQPNTRRGLVYNQPTPDFDGVR